MYLKNSCPEPFHGRLHQRLADPLSAHSASHWVEWFQFFVGCNACWIGRKSINKALAVLLPAPQPRDQGEPLLLTVSALPPSACVPWPSQRLWGQIVMPGYLRVRKGDISSQFFATAAPGQEGGGQRIPSQCKRQHAGGTRQGLSSLTWRGWGLSLKAALAPTASLPGAGLLPVGPPGPRALPRVGAFPGARAVIFS